MPNVYLTQTPEVSPELMITIHGHLTSEEGPLEFMLLEPEVGEWEGIMARVQPNTQGSYSLQQLVGLAGGMRVARNLSKDDFVIVYTALPNAENWWSATLDRDVFVTTRDWEFILNEKAPLAMAHQAVENIFQSLIGIYYTNAIGNQYVHDRTVGCQLDFCKQKIEILAKMKSAAICDKCQQRATELRVDELLRDHIQRILDYLRLEILRRESNNGLVKIKVTYAGEIFLGDRKVDLTHAERLIYVFYLSNSERISKKKLSKHRPKFDYLKGLWGHVTKDMLDNWLNTPDINLAPILTGLNNKIKNILPRKISVFYTVKGGGRSDPGHKIDILDEYREIDVQILNNINGIELDV